MDNLNPQSPVPGDDLMMTTEQVAAWLGIKKCTLEKARSTRMGNFPPFVRIGRVVRYQRGAVEAWLRANSFNVDGTRSFPRAT